MATSGAVSDRRHLPSVDEILRDAGCAALIETYGLTPAQADDFFASPTTIRLNVAGNVQYVSTASLVFGLRVVGD